MGPLAGVKVLEIAALGPAPFASMMLADMGAEVLRIDRTERAEILQFVSAEDGEGSDAPPLDFLSRGRRSASLDLKSSDGVELLLKLVEAADVIIEGFRPGVMERLGAGPEAVPQKKLSVEKLAQGLQQLTEDAGMRQRAQHLGEKINAEDGVATVVRLIEQIMEKQN